MLQEIVGQLIDFFSVMILARLLGPKDFGVVAIAAVIIIAMRPFISQGLGVAITQKSEIENEHLDSVFWSSLLCGCLIAIALATGAGWLAIVFSEPELSDVLPWFALSIVLSSLTTVQEAILRRELNFKIYAIRATTGKLIGGVVGVTMAFYDFGVWSLVARFLVTSFVSVFLLWGLSSWRPGFSFSRRHFSELFPFGIKVLLNELMIFVNRQSDSLLISYFLGSTALGYYNVAYRLMGLVLQLVSATIGQVSMPAFARLQNDQIRLRKAFYDITQLIALIAFPVFLGMQVLVPEIVTALLGEQWGQSTPVLQILLLIGIVQCLASPMISMLIGAGKPGLRLKLQVIDAIVNLIGFFIAAQWGIVWVAASYVIVGYAIFPLWYWTVKTVIPLHLSTYAKLVLRPLIITVVMIGGIICAKEAMWTGVLGINIMGDIIYLALSVIGGILIYVSMTYWLYPSALNNVLDIVKTVFVRQKSSSI